MSADTVIYCDGQWPEKPMYSKHCHEKFEREGGALWPNFVYARGQARLIGGWRVAGDRDQCPACQAMITTQSHAT